MDAFMTAVFLMNRLPSKTLSNKSPFEVIYGGLHVFAVRVFSVVRAIRCYSPRKFDQSNVWGYSS